MGPQDLDQLGLAVRPPAGRGFMKGRFRTVEAGDERGLFLRRSCSGRMSIRTPGRFGRKRRYGRNDGAGIQWGSQFLGAPVALA